MAYTLKQYNHLKAVDKDDSFMTLLKSGVALTKGSLVGGGTGSETSFEDECVRVTDGIFNAGNHYYFHGKIRRMGTEQRLYIKLINYDDEDDYLEQYIKTVRIGAGDTSDWVDIEFMFTPVIDFDSILFELQRESQDYVNPRKVIIAYEEVSLINNIRTNENMMAASSPLIKMGVQSRPGLLMCIEGEEIHTSRSGVYEFKNGVILISFLSVVAPGEEDTDAMQEWMTGDPAESKCFFGAAKTRTIDSFTIDYIYET